MENLEQFCWDFFLAKLKSRAKNDFSTGGGATSTNGRFVLSPVSPHQANSPIDISLISQKNRPKTVYSLFVRREVKITVLLRCRFVKFLCEYCWTMIAIICTETKLKPTELDSLEQMQVQITAWLMDEKLSVFNFLFGLNRTSFTIKILRFSSYEVFWVSS